MVTFTDMESHKLLMIYYVINLHPICQPDIVQTISGLCTHFIPPIFSGYKMGTFATNGLR